MTEEMEVESEAPPLVEESKPPPVEESQSKANQDETDVEEEEETKDVTTRMRKALFAAVEGGDGEDDDVHSFRPLMRLFTPSQTTRSIKPGVTGRELKDLIFGTIKGFHKGHARRFFAGLKPVVERVLDEDEYVPESCFQDDDGEGSVANLHVNAEEILPDARSSRALKFLLSTVQILQAYLDAVQDKRSAGARRSRVGQSISIIDEAFEVADCLHDILLELHGCGPDALPVQTALTSLCENLWLANVEKRENLIPNVLPLIVLKALGVEGKPAQKSDLKRLLKLLDAFQVVDFNDESCNDLRQLLLKLTSSPFCLKLPEGKRLIAGLFLVDPSLVSDLHQAMRIQMPQSKKVVLQTYGEIYKKAWKDSNNSNCQEEMQAAIEEDVLQDLMYSALHIANARMAKTLRVVLEPFHEAKKSTDFEGLLYRMYGPILWRALSAPNPQVRINAAIILGEVFPLREPSHAQADADFQRGAAAVKALLKDKNPKVRVAGSETAAKVLATYWDVLSTDDIRSLLSVIVNKHSSDSSSPQVRVGAIKAITVLLDSPQCHGVLRALLPSLGNLVHDKNKSVRLAAVNMLLKVKMVQGIKYYHVVPVDHLKARLADEGRQSSLNSKAYNPLLYSSPVASDLSRLLLNSFVPQGPDVTAVDQIKRTLSFLVTDPDAAAVFYANLADHLPTLAIAKLTSMLLKCVAAAIETEKKNKANTSIDSKQSSKSFKKGNTSSKKRKSTSTNDSNDSDSDESESEDEDDCREEEENGEVTLTASNTPFMAALTEVIASLWESILDELEYEDNEASQKILVRSCSGSTLTDMLKYFEQRSIVNKGMNDTTQNDYYRIRSALIRCAGFLEAKDVEELVSHITTSLQAFSSNTKSRQQRKVSTESLPHHFALLCFWGMTEDVAKSLSASIVSAFDEVDDTTLLSPLPDESQSKKRKSSGGSRRKSSVENGAVPFLLPPEVAMEVLNEILVGSDPGNVTAREAIMDNIKARESLEEMFEVTTQYTGRFFRSAAVQAQTVSDTHFQLIVTVCEAFGRFALHKAGFTAIEEGTMIELNLEAKHLLDWTTEQVLPALLTEGKGIPLQELDLSRISVNDSLVSIEFELNETLEHDPPTPRLTPLAPPRKKGNRQATPEKLDASFEAARDPKYKRKDSRVIPGDSTAMMVRCASSSLLQNVCLVFSEWLRAGAGSGAKEILEAALTWCCILDAKSVKKGADDDDEEEDKENITDDKLTTIQVDLLSSFSRLSFSLAASASDFQLLRVFLNKLPRILDEVGRQDWARQKIETLVQDTVASLVKTASSREGAVVSALDFANESLPAIRAETNESENDKSKDISRRQRDDSGDDYLFPCTTYEVVSCEDFVSSRAVVVASVLHPIVMHKQGSLILAEKLWSNLDANLRSVVSNGEEEKEGNADKQAALLFEAKCLWYLWDSGACRKEPPFKGILRKVEEMYSSNEAFLGDGKPVGRLLQDMVKVEKDDAAVQEPTKAESLSNEESPPEVESPPKDESG